MTIKIEGETRERIAAFLPNAIKKALESYYGFMDREISMGDPKKFSEHHAAGKVAIAHIELLFKLSRLADVGEDDSQLLSELRDAARKEANAYRDGNVP